MNPALALVMLVAGGALLAAGVAAYVAAWLATPVAFALAGAGAALDIAGSLLLVAALRAQWGRGDG